MSHRRHNRYNELSTSALYKNMNRVRNGRRRNQMARVLNARGEL